MKRVLVLGSVLGFLGLTIGSGGAASLAACRNGGRAPPRGPIGNLAGLDVEQLVRLRRYGRCRHQADARYGHMAGPDGQEDKRFFLKLGGHRRRR